MPRLSTYELLEIAENEGKGFRLTPSQVSDILDEVRELELMREIDGVYVAKLIEQFTGQRPTGIN